MLRLTYYIYSVNTKATPFGRTDSLSIEARGLARRRRRPAIPNKRINQPCAYLYRMCELFLMIKQHYRLYNLIDLDH